jgi:NTE family protein
VIIYAFEAMQGVVNRYRVDGFPPHVVITIPTDACRSLDFQRAAPMVELGRELTADALEAFETRPSQTPSSPSSTLPIGGRCA